MGSIRVRVHLSDEQNAPFQLELEHDEIVVLDYVKDMNEAPKILTENLVDLRQDFKRESMPEILTHDQYEFEFRYDIRSILIKYSDILTQSSVARISGMNKSLLSQYLSPTQPKVMSAKQAKRVEKSLHKLGKELLDIRLDY